MKSVGDSCVSRTMARKLAVRRVRRPRKVGNGILATSPGLLVGQELDSRPLFVKGFDRGVVVGEHGGRGAARGFFTKKAELGGQVEAEAVLLLELLGALQQLFPRKASGLLLGHHDDVAVLLSDKGIVFGEDRGIGGAVRVVEARAAVEIFPTTTPCGVRWARASSRNSLVLRWKGM